MAPNSSCRYFLHLDATLVGLEMLKRFNSLPTKVVAELDLEHRENSFVNVCHWW